MREKGKGGSKEGWKKKGREKRRKGKREREGECVYVWV